MTIRYKTTNNKRRHLFEMSFNICFKCLQHTYMYNDTLEFEFETKKQTMRLLFFSDHKWKKKRKEEDWVCRTLRYVIMIDGLIWVMFLYAVRKIIIWITSNSWIVNSTEKINMKSSSIHTIVWTWNIFSHFYCVSLIFIIWTTCSHVWNF